MKSKIENSWKERGSRGKVNRRNYKVKGEGKKEEVSRKADSRGQTKAVGEGTAERQGSHM